MTRSLRVFLCHSSNDKPAVRELYQKLRAETWVQPWLDEEELYPGQDWNLEIEKAVEASDVILVCLSKGSITKEGYVQRELRSVLDFAEYKPEGTLYIIPVRLEECEPPRRLRAWQYADYFEGQRQRAFQRLLVSLKRRADTLGLGEEKNGKAKTEVQVKSELADQAVVEKRVVETTDKVLREKEELEAVAKLEIAQQVEQEEPKNPTAEKMVNEMRVGDGQKQEKVVTRPIPANEKKQSYYPAVKTGFVWIGFAGVALFLLICGGFGLMYLINNLPVATASVKIPPVATGTISSVVKTRTVESTTLTSVPDTFTPQPTKIPVPIPTLEIGSTIIGEDGAILLYVPEGEFLMGSKDNAIPSFDHEKPQHSVKLDAFWIDQTEVTNKQYHACVSDKGCDPPSDISSFTRLNYYENAQYDDFPVIYVDWFQANAYCSWAGRELPTEAQWEKAARGIDARIYPWGNDAPNKNLLNYNSIVGDTTKVGNYETGKSFYGAYDMAGNVWEWVNDWYDKTYYRSSPSLNPSGPSSGQIKVLRGGSWKNDYVVSVRTAFRFPDNDFASRDSYGFRCARSP